ncbi:MAG: hypothetical protein NVSMB33_15050 [Ktedonobacteraceae bacterium]
MRRSNKYIVSLLALLIALMGLFGITQVSAVRQDQHTSLHKTASAQAIVGHMLTRRTVNMSTVPRMQYPHYVSDSTGTDNASSAIQLNQRLAYKNAPLDQHPHAALKGKPFVNVNTPPPAGSFQGMADSSLVCSTGCQAPDMALGTSSSWVFQGVNRSFAVYDTKGNLQPGWPKDFQNFFGVPSPGNCNPKANLFDPRAFYDPNDQRFWAAILNNQGVRDTCPFASHAWIAVSQTNNPNGVWNIYSFDMTLSTQNWADFSMLGYDQHAVYFSANMFSLPASANTFQYEDVFAFNKATMEAGQPVTPYGFTNLSNGGVTVDTVEPVEVEALYGAGPSAGLFINSFDLNSNHCIQGCNSLVIWAIANPGTPSQSLSSMTVPTLTYSPAPQADQPGCTHCLEVSPPVISGTPVWRNGQITFSMQTGVNNGTSVVPGILWGQINVTLNTTGAITQTSVYQNGYFSYTGDTGALYPTVIPDVHNNLVMIFQETGSTLYPSAVYAVQPASSPLGTFPDGGVILKQGEASTKILRWGDYSAVSAKGALSNSVWVASEYETANQDWSTYLGTIYLPS